MEKKTQMIRLEGRDDAVAKEEREGRGQGKDSRRSLLFDGKRSGRG